MKALNNMKFICEASAKFNYWRQAIDEAETYESARQRANCAIGYLDCMITYLNCMICKENNGFPGDLGEQIEDMEASIYQHLADKASATEQGREIIQKLLEKRDEILGD